MKHTRFSHIKISDIYFNVSFRYVIIKIIIVKKNSSFIGENRGKEGGGG